ncbi:YwqG family protein [Ktedonosporobacter rubrisoli]|nr:YwqG family protein [Ktedonosporobacter rubrisoli]
MNSSQKKLDEDLAQIHMKLGEAGLATFEQLLLATRQPALRLKMTPQDVVPIGQSKFGGQPDLPPAMAYPTIGSTGSIDTGAPAETPLSFLVQINLAEIACFDFARELLPETGMLYFFAWNESDDPVPDIALPQLNERYGACVLYWDGDLTTLRPDMPSNGVYPFPQSSLTFEPNWTFPQEWTADDGDSEKEQAFFTFSEEIIVDGIFCDDDRQLCDYPQRMLGYASFQQGPPMDKADMQDFVLLLQLEYTVPGMKDFMWLGDAGTLYYLIRRKDLQERRFDLARTEGQCG